jgi:hypothetical protein
MVFMLVIVGKFVLPKRMCADEVKVLNVSIMILIVLSR